ncbi:MAG: hypothetical protein ACU0GG_12855 [Paracoccaceae bacterium]
MARTLLLGAMVLLSSPAFAQTGCLVDQDGALEGEISEDGITRVKHASFCDDSFGRALVVSRVCASTRKRVRFEWPMAGWVSGKSGVPGESCYFKADEYSAADATVSVLETTSGTSRSAELFVPKVNVDEGSYFSSIRKSPLVGSSDPQTIMEFIAQEEGDGTAITISKDGETEVSLAISSEVLSEGLREQLSSLRTLSFDSISDLIGPLEGDEGVSLEERGLSAGIAVQPDFEDAGDGPASTGFFVSVPFETFLRSMAVCVTDRARSIEQSVTFCSFPGAG